MGKVAYSISQPVEVPAIHVAVIGIPLLIIALFCFGLVLMGPRSTHHNVSAATNQNLPAKTSPKDGLTQVNLSPSQQLPLLVTQADPGSNLNSADSNDSNLTANPQTSQATHGLQGNNGNGKKANNAATNWWAQLWSGLSQSGIPPANR